ncbi:hypothetical protein GLOIN_2v1768861 [Rhizophagus irregularis DAOM 181602=DAOM 197198]|nr:hypothetical protein GLOIN_2v1768861 [Rhizophagus irregularis DAOM 181602=DAOM 197198]
MVSFCKVLRVEEAIFRDADADDRDAGVEVAIFGGVGVDEVAIFGAVAVEEAIFCGVSVDEVVIFRDADVDDRDAGVEEAIFRDADADDCDAGVEVAIFGDVGVDEVAIFCSAGVDGSAIFGGGVFGFDSFLRVIIGFFFQKKKKEIFCTNEEIGPPFISIFYYQIRLSTINDQLHLNICIKLDSQQSTINYT